jgi:dimethylamine/trimethylamine dehydrogenase
MNRQYDDTGDIHLNRKAQLTRNARYDVLFEQVPIGPKTLKNRFYQVPHCTSFGVVKPWTQARNRSMKAEGGWAAVCTEFAPIGPEGDAGDRASRLWDGGDVAAFSLMCDEVHAHGALAGIELHHGGVYSGRTDSRRHALAPSAIVVADHQLPADPARQAAKCAVRAGHAPG